uniref:Sushi domain-containing protein n=1 Tax=Ascaris lumbricoides TaxID=6252 RepID=A0A9J2P6Z7_ASCLU
MGAPSQSLTEVSERLSSFHMPRCIVAIVTVLLVHAITAVYVMIDKVEYEEYDYSDQPDDYGNEEMLWGNELNPQWCDPPLLNDTYGDRFSVRNSFINPNSKGQYATETLIEMRCGEGRRLKLNTSLVHPLRAAYLRCTLSTLALRGEWALVGMLDYFASFTPTCTSEAATFVICDLPHLNPDEFVIDRSKKARFYKHNETLTLRCAKSDARLLPNGSHTLRCDDTGWIHEVNKRPVADVSPVCGVYEEAQWCPFKVTLSCKSQSLRLNGHSEVICAESQIVDGSMWHPIKWPLCSSKRVYEEAQWCPFKVTLSCKSQSLRLNGHSEVICAESQIVDGSMWHPIKWPLCSSKLNCLTPYIHLGDYLAEDSSNIFRPGSRVSFECFEEHKLIGSRVVECTDVGYWNDTLPTCVEVNCLTPYIHLGDYLAEDSSNIFRPGSRVSFECFEEHKLIGSRVVECTDVGYWNDTLPTCVEVNCLTPYIHLGDYLAEDSSNIFRPGSRVSFECFEEHKLIGSRVVECTDVGYWNDTLPTCVEDVKEINESLVYSALIVTKVILLFILAFMIKLIRDQNRKFRREAYNRSLKVY